MTNTFMAASPKSVANFAISFYWPALVAALIILSWRIWHTRSYLEAGWKLSVYNERYSRSFFLHTSLFPVTLWAWLAHRHAVLTNGTHAAVYPDQILASMQDFTGAIVLLLVILLIDAAGQVFMKRNHGSSNFTVSYPLPSVPILLLPILDWIFLSYSWWLYVVVLGS